MKTKYTFFYIAVLIQLSCSNSNNSLFDNYLKETFELRFSSKKLYILIPTNSCQSCIDKVIAALSGVNKTTNFIIILVDYSNTSMLLLEGKLKQFKIIKDLKIMSIKKQIINRYPKLIWKDENLYNELEINYSNSKKIIQMMNLVNEHELTTGSSTK